METNKLFYGDNLEIMRKYIPAESVDLIYLDPPFNSKANYNVLFKERNGTESAAQVTAFEDTWHWYSAASSYHELVTSGPRKLSDLMQALHTILGQNDMMAYLTMMAIRLVEMHRILKKTGSIYLHCDPVASHYLKLLMDSAFGPENFRSEIIWRRTNSHNKISLQYGPIHDTILFFSKSNYFTFHPGFRPYSRAYIESRFVHQDTHGRHQLNYLTGPGKRSGDSGKSWRGFDPNSTNRHWAIPASLRKFLPNGGSEIKTQDMLESLFDQGFIVFPKKEGGQPMYRQYIGPGVTYQDIWAYQPNTPGVLYNSDECIDEDVKYLEGEDEKLGYETQKPIGLLERIINSSSDEGDVVMDPFCGCGTAVIAAEKLKRRWIGIDITYLAINLIVDRLKTTYSMEDGHSSGGENLSPYEIIGEPKDLESAKALAEQDKHEFEYWATGVVGARPINDKKKKGADKGVDGVLTFFDDETGQAKKIIVQVKGGHVNRGQIATLKGDMEREKAVIGVFITLLNPTGPMRDEAGGAGFYIAPDGYNYPRVQILNIEDLISKKQIQYPKYRVNTTLQKAPRKSKAAKEEQIKLFDTERRLPPREHES